MPLHILLCIKVWVLQKNLTEFEIANFESGEKKLRKFFYLAFEVLVNDQILVAK